jgi:hypothetical protein
MQQKFLLAVSGLPESILVVMMTTWKLKADIETTFLHENLKGTI